MNRRRFLRGASALPAFALLASGCGAIRRTGSDDGIPGSAEEILAAVDLPRPDFPVRLDAGPIRGDEQWSKTVIFTRDAARIEDWIDTAFEGGITSRAQADDEEEPATRLGTGVQKKGDRVTSGTHGPHAYVVVVGQQDRPTVHVGVRREGR
ncbi:hypothetical protein BH708_15990 [Brachybacterium sp. P6-10-X1]|uniref:hypothetical protein n=1 Tax=Brachybacterium sp. P6-10-X1 TaxID=1903186 RepID=UPI000971A305|nr:hypothetical protein [Brachybacterium sp. P6-10-X1]APX33959.1 hypothetical protein BH708_15990 [Brachybacterium sp. P6-10-X1]